MAGFFDEFNDALQGMSAGMNIGDRIAGYMDLARQRQQALQDTRDYQTLLARYNVNPQMGGDVPAAFFLEAAQIPALRAGLLTGAQTQQGAMARQQQGQQFGLENVSMADRLRMEAEDRQQAAAQARWEQERTTLSAFQQAQIEQDRQRTAIQRQAEQRQAAAASAKGGLLGLPDPQKGQYYAPQPGGGVALENIPGSDQARKAEDEAARLARALGSVDKLEGFYNTEGTFGSGPIAGEAAASYLDVVAARAKKADAGAMSDQEIEFYGSGLANPLKAGSLLTRTSTAVGTLQGIRSELQNQLLDFLTANPEVARNNPQLLALVSAQAEARKKSRSLLGGQ